MGEDVAADLKQFITRIIIQQAADIRQDLRRLDDRIVNLEIKVDNGFVAVANALEDINNASDVQLKQHGKRLTRLERKVFKEDYHGPIRQT